MKNNTIPLPKLIYPDGCRRMTEEEVGKYQLRAGEADVVDVLWVAIGLINIKNRKHQTRKNDSKPEKIQEYERDLAVRGLLEIILVEWDSINQCFIPVTGYTRTNAALNLKWTHLPVAVIDIAPMVGKPLWDLLQQQNNHPPATPHNMEDALNGLQGLKDMGYFANKTEEQITKECHDELRKYYSSFTKAKRTQVINEVFEWETNRTRILGKGERERFLKEAYPKGISKIKKGKLSSSGVIVFHTDNSNAAKMLGNKIASLAAEKERVEQIDNETWMPVQINAVVSIAGRDADKVHEARKAVLDTFKCINKQGIQSSLGRLHEVVFPYQIVEPKPETENFKYRWNVKQKTFLKVKNKLYKKTS